ncbi:MAG TPA: O-antigen ligase family protein [Solirubrobacteraceae bacterium]|nr:O-antigen ligase family protein [Solirubrobacteraceae bacterium]
MTALLRLRESASAAWVAAGGVLVCAILGLLVGVSPKYAIEGVLGIGFVLLVFADLAAGVAIFAALSFLSDITSGSSALSFDKVLGILLIASWLARRSTSARSDARTVIGNHPRLFAAIIAFLAWSTLSVLWAVSSGTAFSYLFVDVLDLLLIPVVYGAIGTRRDAYLIVGGFIAGGIVTAGYGLLHPATAPVAGTVYQPGRLASAAGDANQTAADLAATLMMALGLGVVARRSVPVRVLAVVAIAFSLIGIVQTLSRSGLVALGAGLLGGVIFGGRWRRQAIRLLVLGVVLVVGYFALFASASSVSRVTSSNSDGRNTIWTVAWRMFEANPGLGVGTGNFQTAAHMYLVRPGSTPSGYLIITTPEPTHNVYLQMLAELGVPGLILLLAVFVGGVLVALRAAHIFDRLGDRELEVLARCAVLALVAYLASDFFLPDLQLKQFWLVFAIGLATFKLARTELRPSA